MKLKKMLKNIAIFILIVIIIFAVKQCSDIQKDAKQNRENSAAKEYNLEVRHNKDGKTITEQQQVIVDTKIERDELIVKVKGLTKITEQVRAKVKTKIDSSVATIKVPVYVYLGDTTALVLPAPFNKLDDEWHGYVGFIRKDGKIQMDSIWFVNKPTFTFGTETWSIKKPFKKRRPMVTFQDENPHAKIESMQNVKYGKPAPRFSIGIYGGYGITLKGLGPFIGIGSGYTLIRF